jgi:hypothetical protein
MWDKKIKENIWADELIELKVSLLGNVSPVDPWAIILTPNSFPGEAWRKGPL